MKGIEKLKISNREGDVFFGVTCDAVDRLVLDLSKTLHDEVSVVTSEVVHDDGYTGLGFWSFVIFVEKITLVVGGAAVFAREVTVVTHSIGSKLFTADMTK